MAAGTAQFVGKIYYPELKEIGEGNCYLKFNLGMSSYDNGKKAWTVEFVPLVVFGELARHTHRAITEEGHNFCMAFADVRCRPFVTKSGHKNRIPSFECRQIVTAKAQKNGPAEEKDHDTTGDGTPF
jgi:hypothetical protein